jgi:sterol desaturase/sphingolipid hydroxylase (fatty acid hydroxylase superfamily)
MKRLVGWLGYPVIVGGGMAAGAFALVRGVNMSLAIIVLGGTAMIVIALLERVAPHVPAWNRSQRDIVPDFLHLVVSNAVLVGLTNELVTRVEFLSLWPSTWPFAAQLLLAFVVGEFGIYWAHRWLHGRLWRFHELHHSAHRMYWLNGFRNHPFDAPFQNLLIMAPLALLGAGPDIIAMIALYQALHTPLQHSNVALRTGWLSYVLATAELHRKHHAPDEPTTSGNYGTNLILWDMVFGTFRRPPEETTDVGLFGEPPFPHTYFAQLARPFIPRQER